MLRNEPRTISSCSITDQQVLQMTAHRVGWLPSIKPAAKASILNPPSTGAAHFKSSVHDFFPRIHPQQGTQHLHIETHRRNASQFTQQFCTSYSSGENDSGGRLLPSCPVCVASWKHLAGQHEIQNAALDGFPWSDPAGLFSCSY